MDQIFLAIISFLAAVYSFVTKHGKVGLGFLIYVVAFVLLIPGLASGILADVFRALAMVVFVAGSIVIIWKKKKIEVVENEVSDEKK